MHHNLQTIMMLLDGRSHSVWEHNKYKKKCNNQYNELLPINTRKSVLNMLQNLLN